MRQTALRKRWFLASAGTVFALIGCMTEPAAASCTVQDLGPFSMCVPSDWQLVKGGTDSAAGTFTAEGLSVSYDFGLYSAPLSIPPEASEASGVAMTVDGRAGRKVAYALKSIHFVGVHVPDIRSTSLGSVKLTVLAQTTNSARLNEARAALATIRIKP